MSSGYVDILNIHKHMLMTNNLVIKRLNDSQTYHYQIWISGDTGDE